MISFKCITYARVGFLEEALYSFLQLNNNDSELIIVNDYPLQTLIFEHPQVKIYNLKETFKTIGEKENFAIEKCSGDIIGVFDDDDVCLPNHLDNIKKYWKEDTNMLHWAKGVYYNIPNITSITFLGNSGMVYSREAWEKVGKSPIMNAGGDTELMIDIHSLGEDKVVYATPNNDGVSWFYRWAMPNIYHQSGMGHDVEGKQNIIERHSLYIELERTKGRISVGEITLNPHWNQDYSQLLKDYNENFNNTSK